MPLITPDHLKHIYNRFGFGLKPEEFTPLLNLSKADIVKGILHSSQEDIRMTSGKTALSNVEDLRSVSEEKKQMLIQESKQNILQTGMDWVGRMVNDRAQLRERMTLFWHDHFASSSHFDILVRQQNNTLRRHALGKFGDLLRAMCRDAMLLQYLDNHRNRKQSPNENFARELLELFSLGEGHYSEDDIREAARAFTGHAFNFQGEFVFRPHIHDYGIKTFKGRTGRLTGEDIADIILENRQTAHHIAYKIYRYFVNEEADAGIIESLADEFYNSDYDIEQLVSSILSSSWFYDNSSIGTKVKSPVDLIIGLMKHCSIDFRNDRLLVGISRIMGQTLFHPPNVAGWPLGKQWVDSSSLLFRMRLADFLILGQKINERTKVPVDMQAAGLDERFFESNNAVSFDLAGLRQLSGEGPVNTQLSNLAAFLLNTDPADSSEVLQSWADPAIDIKDLVILNVLRLPEYQLC